jgi:phage terminase small subunit
MLKSPRREKFAQGLAEGKSQLVAYVAAGFKPYRGNACTMANDPEVKARVAELQQRVIDIREFATAQAVTQAVETTLKGTDVIGELAKIGFANILDYMQVGPDGLPNVDWSNLTREQAAAIDSVIVETKQVDGEVVNRRVRFKLIPKTQALDLLGKYFALWKERIEISKAPDNKTAAEQRAELLAELAELGIPISTVGLTEEEGDGVANRPVKGNGTAH